ncbi:hypothetical protein CRG98_005486 [Punica granatum]|uniref:Uncharacterized protein n=1 Tax=Punica granatum TaxID=22663 RepID=A0A2I0L070_PUNGR|nr:hypothetical protein CRG98_005486 [Punica granatum]
MEPFLHRVPVGHDSQSVRSPMPPILRQKTTGSLLWSRFFIGCESVRSPTQLALSEKATPINRYSPDKPDCQSGLPVDPTAPIRVCSFQPSLPTPFATSPTLSSCSEARCIIILHASWLEMIKVEVDETTLSGRAKGTHG